METMTTSSLQQTRTAEVGFWSVGPRCGRKSNKDDGAGRGTGLFALLLVCGMVHSVPLLVLVLSDARKGSGSDGVVDGMSRSELATENGFRKESFAFFGVCM